jgi:hypothetical protein
MSDMIQNTWVEGNQKTFFQNIIQGHIEHVPEMVYTSKQLNIVHTLYYVHKFIPSSSQ